MNLLIEHQCPQCGAPVVLEETDRLLACEFCKVKSYLMPKGFFRYMLPHDAPDEAELFYAPYWRFKGMLFSTVPGGVKNRFIDVSQQAMGSTFLPVSLGLRSQAMTLKFITSKTPGQFLKPTVPAEKMLQTFDDRFGASLPKPIFHQAHVGEALSLIYSPFYIKGNKVFDAILNQPVSPKLPDDFDMALFKGGSPNWPTGFIATLCPNCGWDLMGYRDSLALLCHNCDTIWRPSKDGLRKTGFAHIKGNGEGSIYMPFWRIAADISEIALNSYADLVKLANLPKVVQEGWDELQFRFWVPAFKVRPHVFVNLERKMTLSQPGEKLVKTIPKERLYPVNLPLREALESLKTALGSFLRPAQKLLPLLPDIAVTPRSFLLVYIPFREGHHEYIHDGYRLAINKNQLKLSNNL
jgi:hypothetical protein